MITIKEQSGKSSVKKSVFVLVLLFIQFISNAQASKEALAMQYYDQKEYEKAIEYLEDIYKYNPNTWFGYYYKCLLQLKDYDQAVQISKKQIKINKNDNDNTD